MTALQEVERRERNGDKRRTIREIDAKLRAIGYQLDRSMDSPSWNRFMTGELAGESYPAVNMAVVEADTGIGFANIDARRDANFKALQELRFNESLFALARGRVYGIVKTDVLAVAAFDSGAALLASSIALTAK